MAERTTVRLPEDLIKRAKRKAAAEGSTLTALIEEGLRLVVFEKPKEKAKASPASRTATRPVARGPESTSATARRLQEMDDLEYIERMKHFK